MLISEKLKASSVAEEQPSLMMSDLLAEVKHNREIATRPLGDKLPPLETRVWDAHLYTVLELPANLRDDQEQVYIDIRLANSLVWLSTEFGRRTPDLNVNYVKLSAKIAEGLNKIK